MADSSPKAAKNRRPSAQWTAQFVVASELARHGYVVSFTAGNNTPLADLMVGHPVTGAQFWVDVKGLGSQNSWWGKDKALLPNLFYILAVVGPHKDEDRFFILNQSEFNDLVAQYRNRNSNSEGGFLWAAPHKYEGQWDKLPDWKVPVWTDITMAKRSKKPREQQARRRANRDAREQAKEQAKEQRENTRREFDGVEKLATHLERRSKSNE